MLSHLNMVSAATSISTYLGLRDDDIIFNVLPLAFDYGLYQVLMASRVGASVVLHRSLAFPTKILEAMQKERVTVLPFVPTAFSMVLNVSTLKSYDFSSLRLVTNTAAALSESHIRDIRAAFPQATLFSMYGLTECKRVTYLPPDQLDIRPMSVGRGMPNEEVWLVDEHGKRLPNGSTGQLVVRGSNVMRGYWNKPEQTAERLKPGAIPGEMYLYTGDIFRTDEEGYLYFVARKDDIIKSRGEKVSPREVENVLYKIDGVIEAAVIGVPDPVLGQAVKAFVVLKPGSPEIERDVIRYCLAHLESSWHRSYVEFLRAVCRAPTPGKISKKGGVENPDARHKENRTRIHPAELPDGRHGRAAQGRPVVPRSSHPRLHGFIELVTYSRDHLELPHPGRGDDPGESRQPRQHRALRALEDLSA